MYDLLQFIHNLQQALVAKTRTASRGTFQSSLVGCCFARLCANIPWPRCEIQSQRQQKTFLFNTPFSCDKDMWEQYTFNLYIYIVLMHEETTQQINFLELIFFSKRQPPPAAPPFSGLFREMTVSLCRTQSRIFLPAFSHQGIVDLSLAAQSGNRGGWRHRQRRWMGVVRLCTLNGIQPNLIEHMNQVIFKVPIQPRRLSYVKGTVSSDFGFYCLLVFSLFLFPPLYS